jgi:rSAM/selenodomain-associated transferase 1
MIKDRCLIIFIKYPEKGMVKSRLAERFGDEFAAGLYENFIFDLLAILDDMACRMQLYFYPPEKEAEIRELFGDKYEYLPQHGADLGERMSDAFTRSFAEGFSSVILIGSDLPDLPRRIIEEAFAALESQNDAVIGPAADGGYYLIGLKKQAFTPDIFRGLSWSTSSVLAQTTNILQASGHRLCFVDEWFDVDTGADLMSLIARSQKTDFAHSRTMAFLKKRGLLPD